MRKILIVITFLFLFIPAVVNAQIQEKATEQLKEIQNLKDKLANKVAELRDKNERAYAGEITKVGKDSVEILATDAKKFIIKIDSTLTNIYQVQGTSKKEIKFSALKKGDYIIATGPIDAVTVSANFVYLDEQFLAGSGKVSEVNSGEGFVRVIGIDKETYTLDIETGTKRLLINIKSLEPETTTLAKIKEGDTLHFIVSKTGEETEKNRYTARKILVIPQELFINHK